jgi:hypothetical protein
LNATGTTLDKFFPRSSDQQSTSHLDYTSTRFHHDLTHRPQDGTRVISETVDRQNERKAFELARDAQTMKSMQTAQKAQKKEMLAERARERGQQALEKE